MTDALGWRKKFGVIAPEHQHDRRARVLRDDGAGRHGPLQPHPHPQPGHGLRRRHGAPARPDPRRDRRRLRAGPDLRARLHGHGHVRRDVLGRRRGQPRVHSSRSTTSPASRSRPARRPASGRCTLFGAQQDRGRHAVPAGRRRERRAVLRARSASRSPRSRASSARPPCPSRTSPRTSFATRSSRSTATPTPSCSAAPTCRWSAGRRGGALAAQARHRHQRRDLVDGPARQRHRGQAPGLPGPCSATTEPTPRRRACRSADALPAALRATPADCARSAPRVVSLPWPG